MIKFFRNIRKKLIDQGKTTSYLKYAIGEIVLVVIGILIALQINKWNEDYKKSKEQYFILNKLKLDIESDTTHVSEEIENNDFAISQFHFCLEVLARKKEASIEEFRSNLEFILTIGNFDQNKTTFNNIVSSGKIDILKNQTLTDSLISYYNSNYQNWDTAMKDYTRNIIAPFMLNFDHIPQGNGAREDVGDYTVFNINEFDIKPKTIDDYRNEIFIINILRQKLMNFEGQNKEYLILKKSMTRLINVLRMELDKQNES